MEFRNSYFSGPECIDAEISHPDLGWIPCTFSPYDGPTAHMFHAAAPTAKPYVEPEE